MVSEVLLFFFFFNDTATTEIYTLSLHDALPICDLRRRGSEGRCRGVAPSAAGRRAAESRGRGDGRGAGRRDRKSTRLNSSHSQISYAVFCLKKKKTYRRQRIYFMSRLDVANTSI